MFEQNVTSPFTTTVTTPSQTQAQKPLRDSVKQAVNKYLKQLDNTDIENLYELVMAEVDSRKPNPRVNHVRHQPWHAT